jgi:hypothetical protein
MRRTFEDGSAFGLLNLDGRLSHVVDKGELDEVKAGRFVLTARGGKGFFLNRPNQHGERKQVSLADICVLASEKRNRKVAVKKGRGFKTCLRKHRTNDHPRPSSEDASSDADLAGVESGAKESGKGSRRAGVLL